MRRVLNEGNIFNAGGRSEAVMMNCRLCGFMLVMIKPFFKEAAVLIKAPRRVAPACYFRHTTRFTKSVYE